MRQPPKIYSAGELLQMRDTSIIEGLGPRLRKILRGNSDLIEVARRPIEKGPGSKLPRIPEECRETSACSDGSLQSKRLAARQLDGTDSEWKYRGRSESEDSESQPIPAPTGLSSQRDEGFQRFYKAVVSPTHVRVTAGGRIVPNNRVSSPTAKIHKDKTAPDGSFGYHLPHSLDVDQTRLPLPVGMFGSFPPLYPGFAPGVNPSQLPGGFQQYPLFPWQLGVNMGGNFAIPAPPGHPMQPNIQTSGKFNEDPLGKKQSDPSVPDRAGTLHAPMMAGRLDPARSHFWGGQWYIPQSGHFYPYGMAAAPGFHGSSFPMPMAGPHVMAMSVPPGLDGSKPNQMSDNNASCHSTDHGSRMIPAFAPTSNPPTSSIRPSEITKRHLDILKTRLTYLEDQLNYNKHQIDEKAVEADAQVVRQYISQFEKNLEVQQSLEEVQNTQAGQKSSTAVSDGDPSLVTSKGDQSGATDSCRDGYNSHEHSTGHKTGRDRSGSKAKPAINSSSSFPAFASWNIPTALGVDQFSGKSTLPVNAAMAAPFQPHAEISGGSTGHLSHTQCRTSSGEDTSAAQISAPADDTMGSGHTVTTRLAAAAPYLVGKLPNGFRPDRIRDTDYVYGRPLTEDELRARHMYWGKAPRHLQKGLPKFNGKDFFPPSPSKDRSSGDTSSPTFSIREVSFERTGISEKAPALKASPDPFQSLSASGQILTRNGPGNSTQSECLHRPEHGSSGGATVATNRSMPQAMRAGHSLDEINQGSEETEPSSTGSMKEKSSSDEVEEDERELIFTGRRSMSRTAGRTHNEIWTNMLKRGPPSGNAAPGAISSATAQGVLPHYAGHATASLTPAITNKPNSPQSAASKRGDQIDSKSRNHLSPRRTENCPPNELGLEEAF